MSVEFREALCSYVAKTHAGYGRRTRVEQILMERQLSRVAASVERLDDEAYEAASTQGLDSPRVRYLEFVREQIPRWLGEAR